MATNELSSIRKLLRSRNLDSIRQGAELVIALDDPDIWHEVFDGVRYEQDTVRKVRTGYKNPGVHTIGRLIPGRFFDANLKSVLWDEAALNALIGHCPLPIRDEITALAVGGVTGEHATVAPLINSLGLLPNLRHLHMTIHQPWDDFSPLKSSRSLTKLTIDGTCRVVTVADLPTIAELHVEIDGVASFQDLPQLRIAEITVEKIIESPGLKSVQDLTLTGVANAAQILAACPDLQQFAVDAFHTNAVVFPKGATVTSGLLKLAPDSHTLTNIETLVGLQALDVQSANEPVPLDLIARCPELRTLDLRHADIDDLSMFKGHPELRMIAVHGTSIDKQALTPALRKLVSTAREPDMEKARNRPLKPSRSAVKLDAASRAQLSRLRKMLTTPDAAAVRQGLEICKALEAPAIYDALLEGISYIGPESYSSRYGATATTVGRVVPNKIFSGSKKNQPWLNLALLGLLTQSDHPVKAEVTALTIGAQRSVRGHDGIPHCVADDFLLSELAAFPNLVELDLALNYAITANLHALAEVPLQRLTVWYQKQVTVPSHATLRELSIPEAEFEADGHWPCLESITLSHAAANLAHLNTAAPRLHTIVSSSAVGVLRNMPELRSARIRRGVSIHDCPKLETVEADFARACELSKLPQLRSLVLSKSTVNGVDLNEFTNLESLTINEVTGLETISVPEGASTDAPVLLAGPVTDLGNLGQLKGLRHLALRSTKPVSLESLRSATELRVLDIRDATGVTDLEPLVALPELRIIAGRNCGVDSVPNELTSSFSRAAKPDLEAAFNRPVRIKKTSAKSSAAKAPSIPVPEEQRAQWEQVVHGLAGALDRSLAAVDLAASLDPTGIEFLLTKVSVVKHKLRARSPFKLARPTSTPHVVGRLLSHAAPDSVAAAPLRALKALRIEGKTWSDWPIVTGDLHEFTALEHLVVRKTKSVIVDDLSKMTQLHTLVLAGDDIQVTGLPDSLRRVMFARTSRPPLGALVGTLVEELALVNFWLEVDLGPLAGSSVKEFTISPAYTLRTKNQDALLTVPLTTLSTPNGSRFRELANHPTLQTVRARPLHEQSWDIASA